MRRIDWIFLSVTLALLLVWTVFSGRDGFKGSNALIVARTFSFTATIDGQVDSEPPAVGAHIKPSDLLVRIQNLRFDRSRLSELESEVEYFQREKLNRKENQGEIDTLLTEYRRKSAVHTEWVLHDSRLNALGNQQQLEIARQTRALKHEQQSRMAQLFNTQYASNATMQSAKTNAVIADHMVLLSKARLERDLLLQKTVHTNGAFFDNGDASYWDRMIDALTLRQMENNQAIATFDAQLKRVREQATVERRRIESSVVEEHRAPFEGLVSATYVSQGSRVTTGTSLIQVLDCAEPVVIVPIPEHRITEFSVGLKVTVYPVDTDKVLKGHIKYVSSGPLIGNDQTLFVQENLTLSGLHAVVNFEDNQSYASAAQPCESAHQAVVMIHTKSKLRTAQNWLAALF